VGTVGFTEWNVDDAAVKRTALRSAKRTVVAVDSSKFGREAFARLCGPADVDLVVTDTAVDAEESRRLAMAGTELVIA
jgi:DeoR/GlpR family transcriptional regulator of sugar metabolism